MTPFSPTIKESGSKTVGRRQDDRRLPPILRLPSELLLEIMTILWDAAVTEADRLRWMHCLSLVCKDISAAFDRVSQRVVRIASEEFYNYYMRRVSKLDQSHPMNTRCKSLCFDVDCTRMELELFPYAVEPLFMEFQQDGLGYFNNGKHFHAKGIFPNLTTLFIHIRNFSIRDAYQALFPHCMPRTIQYLHINYTSRLISAGFWTEDRTIEYLRRETPVRYLSIPGPHKLKRLTVTGVHSRIDVARLWESLFEVEEFIVDGQALPVGEDKPWGFDMNQALDMLEMGCKGIGWDWAKRRRSHRNPLDELANRSVRVDGTVEPQVSPTRLIRRLTTGTIERTTMPRIKRSKTCWVVPITDYPYGIRLTLDDE